MFYDRKIKYLDYYEGGIKVNGGGFAKLEVRGNILRLELTIRGLHPTDSFERDIVLQGAEKEETLGQIRIQNGSGQFHYSCSADQEIGTTGISYSELRGIRIPIGGTREILCQWGNLSDRKRITPPEKSTPKSQSDLQEPKKEPAAENHTDNNKADSEAPVCTEDEQTLEPELEKAEKAIFKVEEQARDRTKDEPDIAGDNRVEQSDVENEPVKLMEDKWQQLSAIYPHIQPFRDERDYLSLTPSDFVLFPNRFYRAVNNSFLLHGYYNYHHLILARIERRGDILYYIGVPGNYFEREKQVAIMFGFESFECETEPAKTGDFGYYMMRTEL